MKHRDFRSLPSSAGRDSFQGDGGPQRRALQDGGGQDFWGNTPGDSWVDRAAEAFGRARSSGRTARASRRRQAQPQAGEGDLRGHRGSLPGSIEASVLSLDAGSGGAPDSTTVWCKAFGLDARRQFVRMLCSRISRKAHGFQRSSAQFRYPMHPPCRVWGRTPMTCNP